MDKYLAGWQNENEQWCKARKREWKLIEPVVDRYSPRDKEERATLKDFFLTGNLDFNNYNGFRIEFLKEDDQEITSDFDCALDGIHGRVFLLMLFSPIQTEEMYRYIIEQVKKRKEEIWQKELKQARDSYLTCSLSHRLIHFKRKLEYSDCTALAGRDELLFKFLHGTSLDEDIHYVLHKDKTHYACLVVHNLFSEIRQSLMTPYLNDKDIFIFKRSYLDSALDATKRFEALSTSAPAIENVKATIFLVLYIIENREDFSSVKYNIANMFMQLCTERRDDFKAPISEMILESIDLWKTPAGQREWDTFKPRLWSAWTASTWLDKKAFDKFGKPKNGDLQ